MFPNADCYPADLQDIIRRIIAENEFWETLGKLFADFPEADPE